jgi:hypothetical protein
MNIYPSKRLKSDNFPEKMQIIICKAVKIIYSNTAKSSTSLTVFTIIVRFQIKMCYYLF